MQVRAQSDPALGSHQRNLQKKQQPSNGARQVVDDHLRSIKPSVQSRHPQLLSETIHSSGSKFLQTQKKIRAHRNVPLQERLKMEMKLANGMVRSRTVLSDWQSGLHAINVAQATRNPQKLAVELERWGFAPDHPAVEQASQTLQVWREQRVQELRDALESGDVAQLEELVRDSTSKPPDEPEELTHAKEVVRQSQKQRDALVKAARTGDAWYVKRALKKWDCGDALLLSTIARMDVPSLNVVLASSDEKDTMHREDNGYRVSKEEKMREASIRVIARATKGLQKALEEGSAEAIHASTAKMERRLQDLDEKKVNENVTSSLQRLISEGKTLSALCEAEASNDVEAIRVELSQCAQLDIPKHRVESMSLGNLKRRLLA